MTTATQKFSPSVTAEKALKAPLTLTAVIAAFFMVNLRESLATVTSADKSDAAFAYGL
jgi:hypothetical protein